MPPTTQNLDSGTAGARGGTLQVRPKAWPTLEMRVVKTINWMLKS